MAAIGRLARLAVNLSSRTVTISARCPRHSHIYIQLCQRSFHDNYSAIPRFLSRHCSSYAGRREDRFQSWDTRSGLDEGVFHIEGQMRRFARADPDAFQECLELLKNTDKVTPFQALIMLRAVGKIYKWPAEKRCSHLQMLWDQISSMGVSMDISHYNAALKVKIENDVGFHPTEFLADLQNKGFSPNKVTYQLLIDCFCERGDVEGAQLVLEAIKEKDLPVSKIMFDSLIKGHMKKGDIGGAQGMLDHMRAAGLEPNGDTYKVLMCGYAKQGNMDAVKQTLAEARQEYIMAQECQLFSVVYSLAHSGHAEDVDQILEVIQNESEQYNNEGRNCMFRLMNSGHTDVAYKVFKTLTLADGQRLKSQVFLRALLETGLPFEEVRTYVQKMEAEGVLTESSASITSWLERLSRPSGRRSGFQSNDIKTMGNSMSVEELELEKKALVEANITTTRIDIILLSKYCASRDTEKADELKASMDARGFQYKAPLLRQLAMLSLTNKNLSEALDYKQQMINEDPTFTDYTSLVLLIARLQIQEGSHEDAVNTLKEYSSRPGILGNIPMMESLSGLCRGVVAAAGEACTPDVTKEIVDTLYDTGYSKTDDGALLGFIIKAYMDKDDLDGVLSALEHCLVKYKRGAKQRQIMRKLVENEDTERLQKVVDLLSRHQDEVEVLTRLAFRFIECDKPKQARKIFQTLRQRINMSVVSQECDIWADLKMTGAMERFVEMSKDMYGFDRDRVLFQLIKVHIVNRDPQRALDSLDYYEEEGLTPKPRTLRFLANFLKRENHPVPFDIPNDQPSREPTAHSASAREPTALSSVAKPSANSPQSAKTTKIYDFEELVQELKRTHEKGERVASMLIPTISNLSVEELESLAEKLFDQEDTTESKVRFIVTSYMFRAYVNSDRVSEIFERTLQDPRLLELSMTSGNIGLIVEKHPELIPQLEEAILSHSEQESPWALNSLINSYLLKGKLKEVSSIVEKHPELKATKSLGRASRNADIHKNEQLLRDMLEEFRDWPNSTMKIVYVYAIKLKCKKNDWQGALSYLDEAQQRGITIQDLSIVLSRQLEPLLLANSQPLPWQEGELEDTKQEPHLHREKQQSIQK